MVNKFDYGLDRAIKEIVGGIFTTILVSSLITTGLIPNYSILLFHLINIAVMIALVLKMPYWATSYIIGWLVGVFIFSYTGLLSIFDFLWYIFPVLFLLIRRFKEIF